MRHAWGLLIVLLASCTNEVTIASNTCGNHVLEPANGEDCDEAGSACTNDCRFACTIGGTECPGGMACGVDGACHAPTGLLHAPTSIAFDVGLVNVSDIDGDQVDDLLGANSGALTFARGGTPPFATVAAQTTPATVSAATMHDYTGDGRADILLPARGGLFAYTTQTGAPQPVAFPFAEAAPGSLIHMRAAPSQGLGTLVLLDLVGDSQGNVTDTRLSIDGSGGSAPCGLLFGPASLRGHAIHTTKDGTSRQLVPIAVNGALDATGHSFSGLCIDGPGVGLNAKKVASAAVSATAAMSITGETFFANLSNGVCPELVVPITDTQGPEVVIVPGAPDASGCNVGTLGPATTTTLTGIGSPLAVIHLSTSAGSALPALVTTNGIYTVNLATHAATQVVPSTRAWQYAVAADVNGDGIEDLITTGTSSDVEVLTQLGSVSVIPQFHQTVIPTTDAIELIAVGDFDGDRELDVAMAAIDSSGSHAGDISIAFADPPAGYSTPVPVAHIDELDYVVAKNLVDPTLPPGFDQQDDLVVAHGGDDLMTESAQITYFYGAGNRQLYAPFTAPQLASAKCAFAVGGKFAGGAYGVVAGFEPESGAPDQPPFVATLPTTDGVNLGRPSATGAADSCTTSPTGGTTDPFCMDDAHYTVWSRSTGDELIALRGDNVDVAAAAPPTCGAFFPGANGSLQRVACSTMFPTPPPFTEYGGTAGASTTAFTGMTFGGARTISVSDDELDVALSGTYTLTTATTVSNKTRLSSVSYAITLLGAVTDSPNGPMFGNLVELGGACPTAAGPSCTPSEVSAFAGMPMYCADAVHAELGSRTVDGVTYGAAGDELVTVCAPKGTLSDVFPAVTVFARFVSADGKVHYETLIPPSGITRAALKVGDVNGDGLDDIMLTSGATGNGIVYTFLQCDSHDASCQQEVGP